MGVSFDEALEIAKSKYPHPINFYEEYKDYFVFGFEDGTEYTGGSRSPIVIRKDDGNALNYITILSELIENPERIGEVISEGRSVPL